MKADAMGRRACEWIVRHEAAFVAEGDSEAAARRRAKYLSELALVAGTLGADMPDGAAFVARAWDALDRGGQLARLLSTWPVAATSYLPFRIVGCRSRELEQSLAEPEWLRDHARWPAFARFAIGVTLQSIGLPLPWDETEVVLAMGFFDPPTPDTSPARAVFLAHAMMWATDMGRNRGRAGERALELYRDVSPHWHRVLAEAGLLDPLGEIVIADACCGCNPRAESLARLARAQRADGSMPFSVDDVANEFDDLYHPTCVAALAGRLSERGTIRTDPA